MKVRIHRGATEIGGSCVEILARSESIVLDAGLPLDLPGGSQPTAPPVVVESLKAIIISHGHVDHYGILPLLPKVPIVMGKVTRQIVQAAAPFMRSSAPDLSGPTMNDRQPFEIGPFRITPYLVDHSACDAYAILVEADGKKLFYSGDFRLHGRKHQQMNRLMASPPDNIDVLMLEGTTIGRAKSFFDWVSEEGIEYQFTQTLRDTTGLALINVSPQNIDRVVSLYRACRRAGRTMLLDLYAAMILEATGSSRIPQSYWEGVALCIPHAQRLQIKRNHWFDDLKRHGRHRIYLKEQVASRPEQYAMLFRRSWMQELETARSLTGACLIHSQWEGYLKEASWQKVEHWRTRHGIPLHQIHTSGHASPEDLQRFAKAISPKILVPIHSANPQSFLTLCPNVECHANGEWWEV